MTKDIIPMDKARFLYFQAVKSIVNYMYLVLIFAIFSAVFYFFLDLYILIIITGILALPAIFYIILWWIKTIGYVHWNKIKRRRQKYAEQQKNENKQDIQA